MPDRHAWIPTIVLCAALLIGCQSTPNADAPAKAPPPAEAPPPPKASPPPVAPVESAPPKQTEPMPAAEPATASMSTSDLQQRLTELGYKPGPVDGLMGPKTVAALKRYQRDQKLRPTGILDRETISRLQKRTP